MLTLFLDTLNVGFRCLRINLHKTCMQVNLVSQGNELNFGDVLSLDCELRPKINKSCLLAIRNPKNVIQKFPF